MAWSRPSRALGGRRPEEAAALALHALVIATCGALLFMIPLALFPRTLLGMIGGAEAANAAAAYSIWYFGAGALPAWLANTFASILRGGGRHALAARGVVGAWLCYPPLAWALMEPAGFGLEGAGMAFAATMTGAAAVMAVVVMRGGAGFVPALRTRLSGALFKRILSVGLVACAMATIANLATILVTARIAHHGAVAVAAYGISARIEFLMIPIAFGVGSALTALVGRAVGGGDWAEARRVAWTGGAVVTLFPTAVAEAFTSDREVSALAARALAVIGPALPFFGMGMAMYFAAMGAGRMAYPVAAGLARIGLAVGGGWVLMDIFGDGLEGQFVAVALGITAYGALTAAAVRKGVWPGRG